MNIKISFAIVALAAASMMACGPSAQNEGAEVSDSLEVSEASGIDFTIDPETSVVNWVGYKVGGKHHGNIAISEGALSVEDGEITGGEFTIDMTGIYVADLEGTDEQAMLTGHLMSPDFFYVYEWNDSTDREKGLNMEQAVHPTATFTIVSVEPLEGDSSATHTIKGNLTLRGTTKGISFPAKVGMDEHDLTAHADFSLNRVDFGAMYGSSEVMSVEAFKDKGIDDEFDVEFQIAAFVADGEEHAMKDEHEHEHHDEVSH